MGADGFIGSHLVEELLSKNIQVIGVDNFSTGQKSNLEEAIKNKRFHLINNSAENLQMDLPRLDYLFIVAGEGWRLNRVLELANWHKSKIVFVSSIELYDRNPNPSLSWFKNTESQIARFAVNNNLNVRVVRLSAVFGPRMHFNVNDPMIKLIQAALLDDLQKESTALEFSSRALFIDDATSLLVKSMLQGSTALKIFDGVNFPVKAAEIKQILLDPIWYEAKGFVPTELPPWPTPNLEKTIKILNWRSRVHLVSALKKTVHFFKERKINPPMPVPVISDQWRKEIEIFKEVLEPPTKKKEKTKLKFRLSRNIILASVGWLLIIYAIIYPSFSIIYGAFTFKYHLSRGAESLQKGDFEGALKNINIAVEGIDRVDELLKSLEVVQKIGFLNTGYQDLTGLVEISRDISKASEEAILASQNLYFANQIITGEAKQSEDFFKKTEDHVILSDQYFSKSIAEISHLEKDNLPGFLINRLNAIEESIRFYAKLSQNARLAIGIFSFALQGDKSFLVLLQQNSELRAGGGVIESLARVDIEKGVVKKIEVYNASEIDKNFNLVVDPPVELKKDLGVSKFTLKDSSFEPDFPTSATKAQWFYNHSDVVGANSKIDGVLVWDVSALFNILSATNSSDVDGISKSIKGNEDFYTTLNKSILNRLIFVPSKNWPDILEALVKSFEEKHMQLFFADTKMFATVNSQNLTAVLPRPSSDPEVLSDFLFISESNVGANRVNFYIDRSYQLETKIMDGVSHKLKINFINKSNSEAWPMGNYKNRMKVYLPLGSTLTDISFGEVDLKSQVASSVDYGRAVFSFLIELKAGEQKNLILNYATASKPAGKLRYKLDVIKQAGALKGSFKWELRGHKEETIITDLSRDRSFEVTLD